MKIITKEGTITTKFDIDDIVYYEEYYGAVDSSVITSIILEKAGKGVSVQYELDFVDYDGLYDESQLFHSEAACKKSIAGEEEVTEEEELKTELERLEKQIKEIKTELNKKGKKKKK